MGSTSVLLEEAEASLSAGDWDQAIKKLETLRQQNVRTTEVYSKLTKTMALRGRFLSVLNLYLEWAESALDSDNLEQAEEALGYAFALRPNSLDAHEMGVRIARLGQDQSQRVSRLTELAFLHLESGVPERSLELLSEAIECAPTDQDLPLQLAELYISVGQIQAGIRQYESCLESYFQTGDKERAIRVLRSLKLLKSDDVEVLLHLGQAYLQSEQIDKAELEFRAILKLDLENKEALLQLAKVCQMQGRFRNGILALNKVLQMEPESALAHQQMGELHLASGEKIKALDSLLKAAHLNLDQNNKEKAADVFKAVLFVDHANQSAINGLVGLGLELPEPRTEILEEIESESESAQEPPETEMAASSPEIPEKSKKKKRRALTRKLEFQGKKFKSKAFFKRQGLGESEEPNPEERPALRAGLGLKDQSKPIFKLKRPPEVREEPASEPLPEVEPVPEVVPTPLAEPIPANEDIEDSIPALEDVFEQEPDMAKEDVMEPQEPLPTIVDDIFQFGDLEEAEPQPALEPDSEIEPLGELDFDSIFDDTEETETEMQSSEVQLDDSAAPDLEAESPEELEALDIGSIFEEETWQDFEESVDETSPVPDSKSWGQESSEQEPLEELDFDSIFDDLAPVSKSLEQELTQEAEFVPDGLFPEEGFSDIFEGFDLTTEEALEPVSFEDSDETEPGQIQLEPEPGPSQDVQEDPLEAEELDFEQLRVQEIARLKPATESQEQATDLTELLAGTLPLEEPLSPEEPDQEPVLVEELVSEVEEKSEQLPEVELEPEPIACDMGTLIQELAQTLEITPGDEKTRLRMAETCLSYGLLETAKEQFSTLRKLNPGSVDIVSKLVKTALWMEDYPAVEEGLWQLASLRFDTGDLVHCQERLGDLLSLNPEHKEGRMLMVDVFLLTEQKKLAAWHLGQMAERWLQEEESEHAISALRRLIEISPSTRAQERLGRLYQTQGRVQEALQVYRLLSSHFEEQEEWDEAVKVLEKMVALDPNHAERERLIALYRQTGRGEQAEAQQLVLAKTWRERGEFEKAIAALSEVLRTNPECFEAERDLVAAYLERGELRKAEAHSELLAERFLELKQYEEAVALFEAWVRLAPSSSRSRERLAQFYQLKGDLEGAKLEWILVTETHRGEGDYERAALSLERALELEPSQKEWRLRLAELKLSELRAPLEALPHLRELFCAEPVAGPVSQLYFQILSELALMTELGEALGRLEPGPASETIKHQTMNEIQTRLTAEPENLELRFGWGELCLGLGELDLAIEQFQRLRKEPDYRFHAYRLLGLCFAKKPGFNMLDLAISQFRKGLSLEGQASEDYLLLRYQLAQILREHGRETQALEQLRACSELHSGYEDVEAQIRELEN